MLTSTDRRVQYQLAAPFPPTFDIPFKYWAASEIHAVLSFPAAPPGKADLELVPAIDYALTPPGDTGTLTRLTAWPADAIRLTIYRAMPLTQDGDLNNGMAINADEVLEKMYDRIHAIAVELAEALGRRLSVPISDPDQDLELPTREQRALKFQFYDAEGRPQAADAVIGTAGVTAYMQALLSTPTAAQALLALGVTAYMQVLLGASDRAAFWATLGKVTASEIDVASVRDIDPDAALLEDVDNLETVIGSQLDGLANIYRQEDDPQTWDPADNPKHNRDLWYKPSTGELTQYNSASDLWEPADQTARDAYTAAADAQLTAEAKRRVFVVEPVPPYDIGDLWVSGAAGSEIILRCKTSKAAGQGYNLADWQAAASNDSGWRHGSDATKIDGGKLFTDTVSALAIKAAEIATLLLRATNAVIVGYSGTGDISTPAEGDRRTYIDGDEIGLEVYTHGEWATERSVKLGGVDSNGNFLPFLSCRGLLGDMADAPTGDPLPAAGYSHFGFDGNRLDQFGADPWTVVGTAPTYDAAIKWAGTHSATYGAASGYLRADGKWTTGASFLIAMRCRSSFSDNHEILTLGVSPNIVRIGVDANGTFYARFEKNGTNTKYNSVATLTADDFNFVVAHYDSAADTITLMVNDHIETFGGPIPGTWAAPSAGNVYVLFDPTKPHWVDELVFKCGLTASAQTLISSEAAVTVDETQKGTLIYTLGTAANIKDGNLDTHTYVRGTLGDGSIFWDLTFAAPRDIVKIEVTSQATGTGYPEPEAWAYDAADDILTHKLLDCDGTKLTERVGNGPLPGVKRVRVGGRMKPAGTLEFRFYEVAIYEGDLSIPAITLEPEVFHQHFKRGRPWDPSHAAPDTLIRARPGGSIVMGSPLVIEARTDDPESPADGLIWLRSDL
jgi:hypothetical protein